MRVTPLLAISLALLAFNGSPVAAAQQTSSKSGQTSSPAKPNKAAQGQPDEGTVADGIYSEKFFLLHYSIPQGWAVKTPEMRQGLPAQENAVLLLSTFAKPTPAAEEINPSVSISAESATSTQSAKTPEDYLESIAQVASARGFSVLNPPGEITLGGVTFLREDFQKQEGELTTYQATMVALRRGYILQITAISGDVEQLTPLLNRLQITAPPTLRKP